MNDSATCLFAMCLDQNDKNPLFLFLFSLSSTLCVCFFLFFFVSLSLCCCKVATVLGLDLLIRYLHVVVVVDQ